MHCTPFPNPFEFNTLHTTICSVLKWGQSISGIGLMPLAPIRVCQKNVLNVQNSLQAVPQLQARWLHNPCRLWGVPTALERGRKFRSDPQVGKVAT